MVRAFYIQSDQADFLLRSLPAKDLIKPLTADRIAGSSMSP